MIIQKAFKIRLYPTKGQKVFFNKTFGCCRIIYNELLGLKQAFYKDYDFAKIKDTELLSFIKREYWFMREADSQGLCNTFIDCMKAYKNFFKGLSKFPKFKKKKEKCSYRNAMCQKKLEKLIQGNKILLPTVGLVNFRQDYDFSKLGIKKIYNVTIEKSKTDKYFCSICCDYEVPEFEHTGECIGLDLGVKDLIITSDGQKFENKKFLKNSEKKIKRLQRQFSKKKKGSKNQEKARLKLAIAHEKLSNKRKDYLHKLTTKLVKENSVICIEDLNVKGMLKNHCQAKSIADCSFSMIRSMLDYKCRWHNRKLIIIDRWYPSSQTCNCCGYKYSPEHYNNVKWNQNIRNWICHECGTALDRDLNAAKNILNEGLRMLDTVGTTEIQACGEDSSVSAMKHRSSTKQENHNASTVENQLSLAVD